MGEVLPNLANVPQHFMATMTIFYLPDGYLQEIWTEWLNLVQLIALDSACCSHQARRQLLTSLRRAVEQQHSEYAEAIRLKRVRGLSDRFFCWAVERDVTMSICIAHELLANSPLRSKFIAKSGLMVREMVCLPRNTSHVDFSTLCTIAKCCPHTTDLTLYGSWTGDDSLREILQFFPSLNRLTLSSAVCSSGGLSSALACSPFLKAISIDFGDRMELAVSAAIPALEELCVTSYDDKLLLALAAHCPRLRVLRRGRGHAARRLMVSDRGVLALLNSCPELRETEVERMGTVSSQLRLELARRRQLETFAPGQWYRVETGFIDAVLAVSATLQSVDFTHCSVADQTLTLCAEVCPLLRSLTATNCREVTAAGIIAIARPENRLRELRVAGTGVNDAAVKFIVEHCRHLEVLHLFCAAQHFGQQNAIDADTVTDVGFQALLESGPALREVDVEHAVHISSHLRAQWVRRCAWQTLRFADWRGLDQTLAKLLLQACPTLTELDCGHWGLVTDAILATAGQSCPLLVTFRLAAMSTVSATGLRALFQPQNKVASVHLGRAGCLGDAAVRAVAELCPQLERFAAPWGMTDATVTALAAGCPLLQNVNLSATKVRRDATGPLVDRCRKLKTLIMNT